MSPRAKSRPESSWRKYTRSIVGASLIALVPHLGRQRLEPWHQLLDLGPGLAQPAVELVDQRGRPLQAADEDVDVDVALLEEVHDRIELAAGLGVAQLVHGDWLLGGGHLSPHSPAP